VFFLLAAGRVAEAASPHDYRGYYLFTGVPDSKDKEILRSPLVKGISMTTRLEALYKAQI